ncbi:NAD-dependent malic enzyme [Pseudomonas sp. CCI3.2]|uniref:NAD-dependent malic enzyme n=1 Tax=unclassified Pseudomonas TaxID=196821 RepID=UPI002AC9BE73|nr:MULTISPECIES: NAD-dependent malic enzyme [unclassified Pseudomonas]MEB0080246.1 NAD-dependent malic enzyme [Pseudomonas sp. MH10out]MEB0094305.1 NAD-dependent malic enzyme [Pseudomonas sp. CCI4.2]MEB0104496.1 NAD-dependent malic enzyme [Pseudomonas sp. CCI3.2]MEB0133153.1 NAD-dependent malic enzyme [Pseudomonas sp. CCI2.4]MEB0158871.1 NAD-dependent malic enzyme [Pseudomonas sp. AH2 (2023)]
MTKSSRPLYISYAGPSLLEMPLLNKGSAFTPQERVEFNLIGLLPQNVETIEEQVERVFSQYNQCASDLDKHIYLRSIQDNNETLFFRLLDSHLDEMLPIIYTPTVGQACQEFSKIYRTHRGLFISYPERDRIDDILRSATKDQIKIIVVTDSERILGLGDQGIGGMGIPIGKLSLYTACGGISPAYTLPIVLDVGTNNQELLDDPMYMGWRHKRVTGQEYYDFVALFIDAVQRRWPEVLLQFEDFAQPNAMPLLEKYRNELCCFNDDIQGTASVAVGTLLAACKAKSETLAQQVVVFVGAGSAGCGIAEHIIAAMTIEGLSESEARKRIFMVDRHGLLTDKMDGLLDFQSRLAQKTADVTSWGAEGFPTLLDVVGHANATVMIGVSGQRGLFTEQVVREMHKHCAKPLIMPMSNPTSKVEATPEEILRWTDGNALVATGSPFAPVEFNGRTIHIAQCNNSYIFPGIGLGVIASKASRITDKMLMAASNALAECSPMVTGSGDAVLPPLTDIQAVSRKIALAVAKEAQAEGLALETSEEMLLAAIERNFWMPNYRTYRRRSV